MPEANVPLLRKTLEHIQNHPDEWEQSIWHCGTKFCFAGHACILSGDRIYHPDGELETQYSEFVVSSEDGEIREIRDRAQTILGLCAHNANVLFDPDNSLPVLERIVQILSEGNSLDNFSFTELD